MNRGTLRGVASLYGVQIATFLVPLITIPFLARVLGSERWGQLAAVQALFLFLSFIVEYGFGFSATREIAAANDNKTLVSKLVAGVFGAKIFLSFVLIVIAALIFIFSRSYREDIALYSWGLVSALVQGFGPIWYYQAVGKIASAAITEIAGRSVAALSVFVFVQSPTEAWRVPFLASIGLAASYGFLIYRMKNIWSFSGITFTGIANALRAGGSMFFFRLTSGLFTTANAAILRLYAPGIEVGYYSGAEKLLSGAKSSILPINQVAFPRLSFLVVNNPGAARVLFKKILILMLGVSTLVAGVSWVFDPKIVGLVFGPDYLKLIDVFRIMILAFPIIALSNVFGMQWMLPNKMDRQFNTVITLSAVVSLVLIFVLAPRYGSIGVAYSFLTAESIVTLGFLCFCVSSVYSPFKNLEEVLT